MNRLSIFMAVFAVAMMSRLAIAQQGLSNVQIKTTHVSGHVYMLEGRGGNLGVSVGQDGVLLVDDQFAPLAEKIRAAIDRIGKGKLKFVLKTHYHGDHTGGNVEFGPEAPIIAKAHYAVIGDLCASGGYYIASAADKIYADKASLVGSIGVIMAGFGFVDSIEKLGIERRVSHAGESKAFLDPFSPQKEEHLAHVDILLNDVYQQFIDTVKQGRGDRLSDDERIFSGLVWTGEQSIKLGLVDALGSAGYVAREIIGEEDIVDFTRRENYLDRFASSLGASFATQLENLLKFKLN